MAFALLKRLLQNMLLAETHPKLVHLNTPSTVVIVVVVVAPSGTRFRLVRHTRTC